MSNMIRKCSISDIPWMVNLSHAKRFNYAKHQKQFWKMSDNSDFIQEKYLLKRLLKML